MTRTAPAGEQLRVAIYARFSSDLQKETSIDDQLRVCREQIARQGWRVVETYTDRELTAQTVFGRDELSRLIRDAQARPRRFDVVVSEALDRISRDQADTPAIWKKLQFHDIDIWTLLEGWVDETTLAMKGYVNSQFSKTLGTKARRGMSSRALEGNKQGGRTYGYATVYDKAEHVREAGKRKRQAGTTVIVEKEAEIIRRIFRDYVAGASTRTIIRALNAEGVPSPRGSTWHPNSLRSGRGEGILRNPIYAGRITWNRQHRKLNPDTGKYVSRKNAAEDVVTGDAPHLAIVTQAQWDAAQALLNTRSQKGNRNRRVQSKHVLSGLLVCGKCGGKFAAVGGRDPANPNVRCLTAHTKGKEACDNPSIKRSVLEERIHRALKDKLLNRRAIEKAAAAANADRKAEIANWNQEERRLEKRLGEIKRQVARLVDAIEKGDRLPKAIGERITALEEEQATVQDKLAAVPQVETKVVDLAVYQNYVQFIEEFDWADLAAHPQGAAAFQRLVERIEIHPRAAGETERPIKLFARLESFIRQPRAAGITVVGSAGRPSHNDTHIVVAA